MRQSCGYSHCEQDEIGWNCISRWIVYIRALIRVCNIWICKISGIGLFCGISSVDLFCVAKTLTFSIMHKLFNNFFSVPAMPVPLTFTIVQVQWP